jgi:hypothetical protein
MKRGRSSQPKRREMLATPFEPLSDDGFLQLVSDGLAIPGQQGTGLLVAKWRDRPGMDPKVFLAALSDQGLSLEVRRFLGDVNVRIVRSGRAKGARSSPRPPAASP